MTDTLETAPRHPDCEHPGEYLRMGDHPDMARFEPGDVKRTTGT